MELAIGDVGAVPHRLIMVEAISALVGTDGQPRDGAPLGALLSAHAAVTPHAPAFSITGSTTSFCHIDEASNRRARLLADRYAVTKGDRVAISLPNRVEFMEAVFAVWKLGAIPCPLSHRASPAECGKLLELIDPRCVVGSGGLPTSRSLLHNVDRDSIQELSCEPLPPLAVTPGRIMNSGGSTGGPKLISDPNPSAWGADKSGRRCSPRSTILLPAPLYHSAPFAYAVMALAQGSHLVCMDRFDPGEWLDAVEQYRPSWVYMVPTMMSRIAKLPNDITQHANLSSIETLIHMAAPCPPQVKRWWIDRIGPERVLEVYGGTERIGAAAIDGVQWLEHPGSVGQASPGFEAMIIGEDGEVLPPGEIGEIYFRGSSGPGANYKYIGSDTRIRGGLDSFGDMGWMDAEGWLYLSDRRTDMVLIGGVNVYPAEVEAALETLPGVLCAAVIGLPDPDIGNRLHAILELAPEQTPPADAFDFVTPALAGLAGVKRPRSFEFTFDRIRDDAGKLRRFQLRADRIGPAFEETP